MSVKLSHSPFRSAPSRRAWLASALCLSMAQAQAATDGAASAHQADGSRGSDAGALFNVVPLSDDPEAFAVDINRREQVAFTEAAPSPGTTRARFYDGRTVRFIVLRGDRQSATRALNDAGQVTGFMDTSRFQGAFRWSAGHGLERLSPPTGQGADINRHGEVAGFTVFGPNPFFASAARWNRAGMAADLGFLGAGTFSQALALNDAGVVAGVAQAPQRNDAYLPFRWSAAEGMMPLSPYPSPNSQAADINAAGAIVGSTAFREDGPDRAFIWTAQRGLRELGGSGPLARATRINDKGMVIGFFGSGYGFAWSERDGLVEIGRPAFSSSIVDDLNHHGEVVGSAANRAFVWTRERGITDLNTRAGQLPAGLVLQRALAISDTGAVVARSNTGLVLLTRRRVAAVAPLAGPLEMSGRLHSGALVSFSAAFSDLDPGDTHRARWDWGDGSAEPGSVAQGRGSGNVSGQHVYRSAGEYTVALAITDSGGRSSTVRRSVTVAPACGCTRDGWR